LLLGTDKKGMTVWHLVAKKCNLETLQKLLEWAKENLTREELINYLLLCADNDGRTFLHLAADRVNLKTLQ
jgi:ankyrin repeat protein